MTQVGKSQGWEGGLAPARVNATQPERGQARLPNHELANLEHSLRISTLY
jgi:hypothetical protein